LRKRKKERKRRLRVRRKKETKKERKKEKIKSEKKERNKGQFVKEDRCFEIRKVNKHGKDRKTGRIGRLQNRLEKRILKKALST
jgi:hypothetical protein